MKPNNTTNRTTTRKRSSPDRFAPRSIDPTLFTDEPTVEITKLEPDRKRPGCVVVRTGRQRLAVIDAQQAQPLGVYSGAQLTESQVEQLLKAEAIGEARRYARRVVAARSMCTAGLARRLTRKGLPEPEARRIAQELADLGAINDQRFAESAARAILARKPAGRSFIIRAVAAKGIDRKTAEAAADLALQSTEESPADSAYKLAQKKVRTLPRSIDKLAARRRVFAALARRGIDPDTARTATEKALKQQHDQD